MFEKATTFNQPIWKWNVYNVEYMDYMCKEATSFNQPLNSWNLSFFDNDVANMFDGAISFNYLRYILAND